MLVTLLLSTLSAWAQEPWQDLYVKDRGYPGYVAHLLYVPREDAWYTTLDQRLFVSHRGGDGWSRVRSTPGKIHALLLDPTGQTLCVAHDEGEPSQGIACRSGLPGSAWTHHHDRYVTIDGVPTVVGDDRSTLLPRTASFATTPQGHWVTGGAFGVAYSTDRGEHWDMRNAWRSETPVHDVRVSADGRTWTAATDRYLWTSTDQGTTWSSTNRQPLTASANDYLRRVLDIQGATTWVAAYRSLWSIRADGTTKLTADCSGAMVWRPGLAICHAEDAASRGAILRVIALEDLGQQQRLPGIAPQPSVLGFRDAPQGVVALTARPFASFAMSADGEGWTRNPEGINARQVEGDATDWLTHPTQGTYFAATTHGLYVQRRRGEAWEPRIRDGVVQLLLDPRNGQLVAANEDAALLRSDDGGWTWQPLDQVPGTDVTVSGLAPFGADGLVVTTLAHGVHLYDGDGWRLVPDDPDLGRLITGAAPADATSIWVTAEHNGLFRLGLSDGTSQRAWVGCELATSVTSQPDNPNHVAVGCEHGKVRVSFDGGTHWRPVETGVRGPVTAVHWPSALPGTLMVGTQDAEVVRLSVAP